MNPGIFRNLCMARAFQAAGTSIVLLGCLGASCLPAMQQDITQHYGPDVIRANDAAGIAGECGTGVGTPQQVAAAAAAAESSRAAAGALRVAMDNLKLAYAAREAATNARVQQDRQADNWNSEIAELQRKAGLALAESAVDHDILHMHGLYLPAHYAAPTPSQPNISPFTNANFLLLATANADARAGLAMAQSAMDRAGNSPDATAGEKTQLQAWLDLATGLAGKVDSANTVGQARRYSTPDDLTQIAVREAYKAMETGFRARALQLTIELRGDAAERSARAAERESEAVAAYQEALRIAGDAQRKAAGAANAAYAAAVACGIDTAPIVPGSPEWNDTFWEISSP